MPTPQKGSKIRRLFLRDNPNDSSKVLKRSAENPSLNLNHRWTGRRSLAPGTTNRSKPGAGSIGIVPSSFLYALSSGNCFSEIICVDAESLKQIVESDSHHSV